MYIHMREGGTVDNTRFMATLRSAVSHLYSVVGAHNDLSPSNIMAKDGLPVLVNFGSCWPLGWKMGSSHGTRGGGENSLTGGVFTTADRYSKTSEDLLALDKLSDWLDGPVDPPNSTYEADASQ
ncbi:hypothetical protein B0T25DRAFT_574874 [Lasiosphaeria hispida]|uniref:Protein kinase domain-containing protein n=1 Tax=Lasiosphaeria hispida TaxID=260671 RepID=A0AAJ0H5I7_9PEZI|nr:hypothetical protein B0T25DRAFT_574874 [Lasiosphaeria hispida]